MRRRKVQCQHLYARGIYGDEINARNGKRGYCWQCNTLLDYLPYSFEVHTRAFRIAHAFYNVGFVAGDPLVEPDV